MNMRKVPEDQGQEGRRLVAAAYVGTRLSGHEDPPSGFVAAALKAGGPLGLAIRLEVVDAVVGRWPALHHPAVSNVIRDLCRGTCAVSDGWRRRLEALAACVQPMDNSGGAE